MCRQILLLALELFRHTIAQQRRELNLCLDSGKLMNISLATVASECSVHLFESLTTSLGDKEPVKCVRKY